MNSFDVLSSATSLLGYRVLEASAGTGKTFAIEHLVVRLILEHGVPLEKILVITFTRAAARELRVRIRASLENICLRKNLPPYLPLLKPEDDLALKTALASFDQASIFTIHGFCQKMLQEFAFESGYSFQMELWEEQEEREAVSLFLRRKSELFSKAELYLVLRKCRFDRERLIDALLKAPEGGEEGEDLYLPFCQVLEKTPPFPLREKVEEVLGEYKRMDPSLFLRQASQLEKLLGRLATQEEFEEIVLEKPYFLTALDPLNRKVKAKKTLDPRLEALRLSLEQILEQARDEKAVLRKMARAWQEDKREVEEREHKITPDELLHKMSKALLSPSFLEKVRLKYEAAFIDEFQDTDPVQWNIFETLFLKTPLKAVYVIGDPKQAIYAFRKADIYTFLHATKQFPSKAKLTTNYRSEKGLLELLNRFFCLKPWMDLPALGHYLEIEPVEAAKQGEEAFLHFFVAEGKRGRETVWPSVEMEETLFFPFIVQEMERQKLAPDSVAILVKDRFQAKRVHAFLQKWQWPVSLQRGENLADSFALKALEELLECLLEEEKGSLKKVLLGPFFKWSLAELIPDNLASAQEVLRALSTLLKEKGFPLFWAHFLKLKLLHKIVLETVVSSSLSFYHDLNEVVEKLSCLKEHTQILTALQKIRTQETEDRVRGEAGSIQILTIHASKGLEFENVFALGVSSRSTARESEDLREIDAEKMRQLYVALTRAKKRLYIPHVIEIDPKPLEKGEGSPLELFWERVQPVLTDYPHTWLKKDQFTLTPYQKETQEELLEPLAPLLKIEPSYLLSFTALSVKDDEFLPPLVLPPSTLPVGADTGVKIHAIFERVFLEKKAIPQIVREELKGTSLEPWEKEIVEGVEKCKALLLDGFSLNDVDIEKMQVEMEFLYPLGNNWMKGFIDLWFEKGGKYYLVDWKTNWLQGYDLSHLEAAMHAGDYFLQAKIYAEALKKYLALFDPRPFEECFGGAFYIFFRGPAVYHVKGG